MAKRKIVHIDEARCNGCGDCIPNCPEGALKVIDGKARLVNDVFCDGLGACLGHCPQGAISIEERDAAAFDEEKAAGHKNVGHLHGPSGCPGSRVIKIESGRSSSELRQWPIQIHLVPVQAPYLNNADILIAADCVPFAYPDFHRDLLRGKVLLVGCPKLDDVESYKEKIAQILKANTVKSITCAHMGVPCCFGLIGAIEDAIAASGKKVSFKDVTVSMQGELSQ